MDSQNVRVKVFSIGQPERSSGEGKQTQTYLFIDGAVELKHALSHVLSHVSWTHQSNQFRTRESSKRKVFIYKHQWNTKWVSQKM